MAELGIKSNIIYLNVGNGKIINKDPRSSDIALYDFIEGALLSVEVKARKMRGESVPFWYINMRGDTGALYSICMAYSSGTAKSILNALASADHIGQVKIETYEKDGYTKALVSNDGQRLEWKHTTFPDIENRQIGGRTIKDDSKRMAFFERLAKEINERCQQGQ